MRSTYFGDCLDIIREYIPAMQRKRNGLVPVGEVFGGLGGSLKELQDSPEGAVRAYTSQNGLVPT